MFSFLLKNQIKLSIKRQSHPMTKKLMHSKKKVCNATAISIFLCFLNHLKKIAYVPSRFLFIAIMH